MVIFTGIITHLLSTYHKPGISPSIRDTKTFDKVSVLEKEI